MMQQLDLFEPATAEIIAFPLSRRAKVVATAAEYLAHSDAAEAARFWRELLREIALPLVRAGLAAETIRAEALAFRAAVEVELSRLGPGGPSGHTVGPISAVGAGGNG